LGIRKQRSCKLRGDYKAGPLIILINYETNTEHIKFFKCKAVICVLFQVVAAPVGMMVNYGQTTSAKQQPDRGRRKARRQQATKNRLVPEYLFRVITYACPVCKW